MSRSVKIAIGLLASLLMGWIYHGPLGRGAALIDALEVQARAALVETELPGLQVRMSRDPLARVAYLSGPANDFQRNGSPPDLQSRQWGINDYVLAVPGMGSVRWLDQSDKGKAVTPLLLETELMILLAYLIGLGLGWLFFGRRKRQSFLD